MENERNRQKLMIYEEDDVRCESTFSYPEDKEMFKMSLSLGNYVNDKRKKAVGY